MIPPQYAPEHGITVTGCFIRKEWFIQDFLLPAPRTTRICLFDPRLCPKRALVGAKHSKYLCRDHQHPKSGTGFFYAFLSRDDDNPRRVN